MLFEFFDRKMKNEAKNVAFADLDLLLTPRHLIRHLEKCRPPATKFCIATS